MTYFLSSQIMSFEWATELLVIRMSRPFEAKLAANRVMIMEFLHDIKKIETCVLDLYAIAKR